MKQNQLKLIKDFKSRYALDASEENVVTTIHLMSTHVIDKDTALDQSSLRNSDFGIDGWYFDKNNNELFVYQSKLSDNKALVLKGLKDLITANKYLENILINGEVTKIPHNKAIYNLFLELSQLNGPIKKISLVLISPLNPNDLLDSNEFMNTENIIRSSDLFAYIYENGGTMLLDIAEYNFDKSTARQNKKYVINKLDNSVISLRNKSFLEITFIPIYSLVELYRQRGEILFHKNVRLSLYDYKDAKNRVVTPMEATLNQICSGKLSPNIFPFYHVGITISATTNSSDSPSEIALETPYVINGCQTITIADHFLSTLESRNDLDSISLFKQISVLSKIVIGTTDDELKEITNSNNRQNPIENWQLFSNDQIHIEIEHALLDCGIFYERQKGKFNALLNKAEFIKEYPKTNQTYIDIEMLGQLIVLARGNNQWTAKPSEIFINKSNHDSVFTNDLVNYAKDMILCLNLFKAAKRALRKYLEIPTHNNDVTGTIFNKPIVKAYAYRTAVLYYYQNSVPEVKFVEWLYKIASPAIVPEFEKIYSKFITKFKTFYLSEKSNDVSSKRLTKYFENLHIELGIDTTTKPMPFSDTSINKVF